MPILTIDNKNIEWSVRYSSRRRTILLRIAGLHRLEITAPVGTGADKLQQLLRDKAAWLLRQMQRLETTVTSSTNASLTHGATLLFQGAPHSLLLLADGGKKPQVTRNHGAIAIHLPELVGYDNDPAVYRTLKKWYGEQALTRLVERTRYWAAHIGVTPSRIALRDQKTRWGSCSSLGAISYNWRIIMAPPPVLDYLVIHELCHMLQANHSPKYWLEVARWCPDYKNQRGWLRQNGGLLGKIFNDQ